MLPASTALLFIPHLFRSQKVCFAAMESLLEKICGGKNTTQGSQGSGLMDYPNF